MLFRPLQSQGSRNPWSPTPCDCPKAPQPHAVNLKSETLRAYGRLTSLHFSVSRASGTAFRRYANSPSPRIGATAAMKLSGIEGFGVSFSEVILAHAKTFEMFRNLFHGQSGYKQPGRKWLGHSELCMEHYTLVSCHDIPTSRAMQVHLRRHRIPSLFVNHCRKRACVCAGMVRTLHRKCDPFTQQHTLCKDGHRDKL